jgi:hypothetical protein
MMDMRIRVIMAKNILRKRNLSRERMIVSDPPVLLGRIEVDYLIGLYRE